MSLAYLLKNAKLLTTSEAGFFEICSTLKGFSECAYWLIGIRPHFSQTQASHASSEVHSRPHKIINATFPQVSQRPYVIVNVAIFLSHSWIDRWSSQDVRGLSRLLSCRVSLLCYLSRVIFASADLSVSSGDLCVPVLLLNQDSIDCLLCSHL